MYVLILSMLVVERSCGVHQLSHEYSPTGLIAAMPTIYTYTHASLRGRFGRNVDCYSSVHSFIDSFIFSGILCVQSTIHSGIA